MGAKAPQPLPEDHGRHPQPISPPPPRVANTAEITAGADRARVRDLEAENARLKQEVESLRAPMTVEKAPRVNQRSDR